MIIYNLFPLLAGPFAQWAPHFQRATAMRFDWVFINPIQYPGYSGSIYSISDYFRYNPLLLDSVKGVSEKDQVRRMVADAHEHGLKLMIDLVINHCAFDAPLTRQHPDWFRHENGQLAHPSCKHGDQTVVWGDLVQFDHRHTRDREGLYRYCLQLVNHLLELGFDGFRCDAAYQLPGEFWRQLIKEVKSRNRECVFAAETLGCTADQTKETAATGFDYIFNSAKWWDFEEAWLIEQYELTHMVVPSIAFPESHDTERLATELNGNVAGLKQRYLFAALFSAGVLMPIGYEFGFRKRLNVVKTRPADWETTDIDLRSFITAVNHIKRKYPLFEEECPTTVLPYHNPNILLLWKAGTRGRYESLLILNKDIHSHQEFTTDHFRHYLQAGAPLHDVSPEYPLDYIPEPFRYSLRPGQGLVLVTSRN
ncbi:MAG TPA: alpha-amylase family glycosyl hydrolase [Verrucomicrobiae bacterium]|nr:alpha-amylase family glycosyl hydrolase [Verrucomicrobiae bacterium]